jgi:hypothetical protein
VRQVADQEFVDEVDRPENVVNQQQDPTVVVVPADHQRVEAENAIKYARTPVIHVGRLMGERNYF